MKIEIEVAKRGSDHDFKYKGFEVLCESYTTWHVYGRGGAELIETLSGLAEVVDFIDAVTCKHPSNKLHL